MHDFCCICDFLISGNFPETAWRAIHNRQAAHNIVCVSWVPWRNCLAVKLCTARRRKSITHLWVSLMNCLAVMNFCQATRVCLTQF